MRHLQTCAIVFMATSVASGCASGDEEADESASSAQDEALTLTSEGIADGRLLEDFKCERKDANGSSASLPLAWSGVPEGAGALAITMHHFPQGNTTNPSSYFSVWNIDPAVTSIEHGSATDGPWHMGANKDRTGIGYTSPCSPSGGDHEYIITLYALSETPDSLPDESSLDVDYNELTSAFESVTVIEQTTLVFIDG